MSLTKELPHPPVVRKVVADLDGLLTDTEKILPPYAEIVAQFLAKNFKMSPSQARDLLEATITKMREDIGKYGWEQEIEGSEETIIVAPPADPYLLYQAAVGELIRNKTLPAENRFLFVEMMYRECSKILKEKGSFFRTHAAEFLNELHAFQGSEGWVILTNAGEQGAIERLKVLSLDFDVTLQVVGGAKKFKVDRENTEVAARGPYMGFYEKYPGFPARGMELQRPEYHNKMKEICDDNLDSIVILEDIFEFPAVYYVAFLKVTIILMFTSLTPEGEKELFSSGDPRLVGVTNLLSILERLQSLSSA